MNKFFMYLLLLFVSVGMPLFVEFETFGLKVWIVKNSSGHGGDWLQFWATYIGIIFSGLLALYLSSREARNSAKQAQREHITNLYLDDLRTMNTIMVSLPFNGNFSMLFLAKDIEFTKEEVKDIQKLFIEYNIRSDRLWSIKCFPELFKIIKGLPLEKIDMFETDVNEMMKLIIRLHAFNSNEFRTVDEMEAREFDKDRKQKSDALRSVMMKISETYKKLANDLKNETATINTLK